MYNIEKSDLIEIIEIARLVLSWKLERVGILDMLDISDEHADDLLKKIEVGLSSQIKNNTENNIISHALGELLHYWKDSDAENLQMNCDDMKNLSEDEIKKLVTALLLQY